MPGGFEGLRIEPVPVDGEAATAILRDYVDEVASRYYGRPATPAEIDAAIAEDPNDDLMPPRGTFLIARDHVGALGCVAVRRLEPGVCELKRMYVVPRARRRGLGRHLVIAAERAAIALDARELRLDTRGDLIEARGLYAAMGFAEIPAYNAGLYAEHWFAKPLTDGSACDAAEGGERVGGTAVRR